MELEKYYFEELKENNDNEDNKENNVSHIITSLLFTSILMGIRFIYIYI